MAHRRRPGDPLAGAPRPADAPAPVVATERARVATEGWGAALLARQTAEGDWGGDTATEQWTSSPEWTCLVALAWLRDMGLDPAIPAGAARGGTGPRQRVAWHWFDDNPFFAGEVEPCINGRVVAVGAYFGAGRAALVDRLLGEQMADGGWNCEQENGSTRRVVPHHDQRARGPARARAGRPAGSPAVTAARQRGRGIPARAPRCCAGCRRGEVDRSGVQPVLVPDRLPLRRPARARPPARRRRAVPDERMAEAIGARRAPSATPTAAGRSRTRTSDQLDARHPASGGRAEPLEHAARHARAALVRGPLRPAGRIAKAWLTDR